MKLNNVASHRAFLEQMPTQELDEMLQAELRKDNIDDDLVRLILDVLEEREADHPIENDEEIAAAVEKYTAYVDSLEATPAKPTRKWNTVLKVASVLLLVGLLFGIVPQAANAESFFEMLARWTDSVFEFFNPSEPNDQPEYVFETDHPGLQQIYDAVGELGVTDPGVPMWVPSVYEVEQVKVIEAPSELMLYANLSNNESKINITIVAHRDGSYLNHTKDTQNVEKFEYANIEHYIMSNNEIKNATWIINNIECSIALDCQEDIYKIIKSIYTMGD